MDSRTNSGLSAPEIVVETTVVRALFSTRQLQSHPCHVRPTPQSVKNLSFVGYTRIISKGLVFTGYMRLHDEFIQDSNRNYCLNEKEHILNCLDSLMDQTFDNSKHLIWILDGGSTDGTIEIIENYIQNLEQNQSPRIELHHNEKKFVPHARNYALKELPDSIEFIVEMIAHCTVPNDLITRNVRKLGIAATVS